MEDLQTGDFNLQPEWINSHLEELKGKFEKFRSKISKELHELKIENKYLYDSFHFDATGRGFNNKPLSHTEGILRQRILEKYSFTRFFTGTQDKEYNRSEVYYSVKKDEPRIFQVVKTCIFLDTNLYLLQSILDSPLPNGSFIIASLLDDIRYKLILLFEDILTHEADNLQNEIEKLTEEAICIYYNYLLCRPQTNISKTHLTNFLRKARDFVNLYLNRLDPDQGPLRDYKEADIPSDNMLFIDKLKKNIPSEKIDIIIGIRFGGIELPYLVKNFIFPKASIKLVKISHYSSNEVNISIDKQQLKGKNVLIVDDGVTTGRTVSSIIDYAKGYCDNIYYACVYYSGYKRIKHMQMDKHGGINLEQLQKCCVLTENKYTKQANKQSYTDKKGHFDKTKHKIESRFTNQIELDLPVVEGLESKDLDTRKVFIVSSESYNSEHYNTLMFIRNYYQKNPHYQSVDDWIIKRIKMVNNIPVYTEPGGRNFLKEAINDIERSDIILFFCPGPSSYVSALFLISAVRDKDVLVFYQKIGDIKDFQNYKKAGLHKISSIQSVLT